MTDKRIVWRKRVGRSGSVIVTTWHRGVVAVVVRPKAGGRLYRAFEVNADGERCYDLSGRESLKEVLSADKYGEVLEEAKRVATTQWVMQG